MRLSYMLMIWAVYSAIAVLPAAAGPVSDEGAAAVPGISPPSGAGPLNADGRWATLTDYQVRVGTVIVGFSESPILAAMVSSGQLPPVEERLPKEPLVIEPLEQPGYYGGQLNVAMGPQSYINREELLVKARPELMIVLPNIAKGFEVSDDRHVVTLSLRDDMKWSDGFPFGADDFVFWYEDILLNEQITPLVPSIWMHGGEIVQISKLDDSTVRFDFSVPAPGFVYVLSDRLGSGTQLGGPFAPEHYLERFHAEHNAEVDELAKEKGFDTWIELFNHKRSVVRNAEELPVLDSWVTDEVSPEYVLLTRNPYYFKVDTLGQQLPYVDHIRGIISSGEVALAKAILGEYDVGSSGSGSAGDMNTLSALKEGEQPGNYRASFEANPNQECATEVAIFINHTVTDPVLGELFNNPRFKWALSYAIDREMINLDVFRGESSPRGSSIRAQGDYGATECKDRFVDYDPELAMQILDEIGVRADAEGRRQRADDKALSLTITVSEQVGNLMRSSIESIAGYWENVGIQTSIRVADMWRSFHTNESEISIYPVEPSGYSDTLSGAQWWSYALLWGKAWYEWYHGRQSDLAAEPPHSAKEFMEAWRKIPATSNKEERDRLGRVALENLCDNLWFIGVVGPAPEVRYANCHLRNVDLDRWPRAYYAFSAAFQWYFDDSSTCVRD